MLKFKRNKKINKIKKNKKRKWKSKIKTAEQKQKLDDMKQKAKASFNKDKKLITGIMDKYNLVKSVDKRILENFEGRIANVYTKFDEFPNKSETEIRAELNSMNSHQVSMFGRICGCESRKSVTIDALIDKINKDKDNKNEQ